MLDDGMVGDAMKELNWGWEKICLTLMWRLAPNGLVLYPRDLDLPRDRTLLEERRSDYIWLAFISLREAYARTHATADRATTDKLYGRWQQIAIVMMWKLAKTGLRLTEADHNAIPKHLELLTSGHPDGVEWRWLPRLEAHAIRRHEFENEGRIITEQSPL